MRFFEHRIPVIGFLLLAWFLFSVGTFAQSSPGDLETVLGEQILAPSAALLQMKSFILSRVPPPPVATSAAQWTEESQRLRRHLLQDVVFHGWPPEWVNSSPKFEEVGTIETHQGYRLRKLRYEVVPGLQSVAILYEPEKLEGKVPAILNVNGHVGPAGKAVEYKQKRCINFAKHGILALNLEWFAFGELQAEGNQHWYGAHLDLVGANALGIFLLEMRRGLDYLCEHPSVDRNRVGVMGHSYGAFMTANLLAHSNLFKAGIARSGAYNRTLTPYGFQNEERTYWQAPEVYYKMSPFSFADKLKTPILLIHGEADNNNGTFPIQSERFYSALKGQGATVRFVLLPLESHGYQGRESVLHMFWEMNNWLNTYVKNVPATTAGSNAGSATPSKP